MQTALPAVDSILVDVGLCSVEPVSSLLAVICGGRLLVMSYCSVPTPHGST